MANITDDPNIPTQIIETPKFPQFCANLGIIPSGYRDSMTYYEIVAWLCKFLEETVIPTVNENGKAVQELQGLYIKLNDYVTNYFKNLDVQNEINNKLDEMVEDGTIQRILNNYTSLEKIYNTFQDLFQDSENLLAGMQVKTLGYYALGDGGGATYKIATSIDPSYIQETLAQNVYANLLLTNNTINFKQLGARAQTQTLKVDNKEYLQKFLNYCKNNQKIYKLYIPTGIWPFSEVVFPQILNGFIIYGDEALNLDYSIAGTIITAFSNDQDSIWSIGETSSTGCKSFTIKNLNFSSGEYDIATFKAPHLLKVKTALNIINSSFRNFRQHRFYKYMGLSFDDCFNMGDVL